MLFFQQKFQKKTTTKISKEDLESKLATLLEAYPNYTPAQYFHQLKTESFPDLADSEKNRVKDMMKRLRGPRPEIFVEGGAMAARQSVDNLDFIDKKNAAAARGTTASKDGGGGLAGLSFVGGKLQLIQYPSISKENQKQNEWPHFYISTPSLDAGRVSKKIN